MKLSTKGQYGVRAMFALALGHGAGPVPLRRIAADQAIPEAFLEQILMQLKRAGLVTSVRGAQGGYLLAEPPEQTSVSRILTALEVSISPVECLEDGSACGRHSSCAMRLVYGRLGEAMAGVLSATTLRDMVEDDERLHAHGNEN